MTQKKLEQITNEIQQYNIVCCYCKKNYDVKRFKNKQPYKGKIYNGKVIEYISHGICNLCLPGVLKANGLDDLVEKYENKK